MTQSDAAFKFHEAVVCDEIRVEANGKFFIIGAYSSEILVNAFPANFNVAFWVPFETLKVGKTQLGLRILGANNAVLGTATGAIDIAAVGRGAFPIPPIPVQVQLESSIQLQIKQTDGDWETVTSIRVKLNPNS